MQNALLNNGSLANRLVVLDKVLKMRINPNERRLIIQTYVHDKGGQTFDFVFNNQRLKQLQKRNFSSCERTDFVVDVTEKKLPESK